MSSEDRDTRSVLAQRAVQAVNTELIELHWQVGAYISGKIEAAEWGDGVVKNSPPIRLTKPPSNAPPCARPGIKPNCWRQNMRESIMDRGIGKVREAEDDSTGIKKRGGSAIELLEILAALSSSAATSERGRVSNGTSRTHPTI
ncbi:hypothetical protein [Pseudomonas fluorescens]|uniref:YhcG N-terminal domain-containing protein n=1 Tax=Pseudomonas fluorescens TaxID=294 RepID=A0A5E7FN87_PSEFL|nr:hypothetical protein PS691_05678 [Pseudomonas fluorescens]